MNVATASHPLPTGWVARVPPEGARRQAPRPAAEREAKRVRARKAQAPSQLVDRELAIAEPRERELLAARVDESLKAHPLFAQLSLQAAGAHAHAAGDGVEPNFTPVERIERNLSMTMRQRRSEIREG